MAKSDHIPFLASGSNHFVVIHNQTSADPSEIQPDVSAQNLEFHLCDPWVSQWG